MKTIELAGELRTEIGKKDLKSLRKEEFVPCILYGSNEGTIVFKVKTAFFRPVIFTPNKYIVNLTIDGKKYASIIKETQYHPTTDELLHADFLQIFEDKKVVIEVPILLKGYAKGVKEGGKLVQNVRNLKVCALPKDLPDVLDINVEDIGVGQSIRVNQLVFDNISIVNFGSIPVASVVSTRDTKKVEEVAPAKKK